MKVSVSIAQISVSNSSPEDNLSKAALLAVEASRRGSDVICFPEMWTTGFNWENNMRIAAEHEKIADAVGDLASKNSIWISGSMLSSAVDGGVSNTSILFNPEGGRSGAYSKVHLFSLIHEDRHMVPGNSVCVVDAPWGRTGLAICYDIRFPELFRTYALKGVKIVFISAAFPHPRLDHWRILLRARAIENQMFIIGTNRVGSEDLGPAGRVTYFGNSAIIDPRGRTVIESDNIGETLLTGVIDMDIVDEVRGEMRVIEDRRPDVYEL